MTKYDIFYLLVMTSNVSSLVCFGTEGDCFSPYCTHSLARLSCVSLCSAYCSSTTFWCDTISMDEKLLYFPRLPDSPTWIAPDTPVCEACFNEECIIFSDLDAGYYFNHLSDHSGYLAKEYYKCCTQPLLQVIHASIVVVRKLHDPPS